MTRAQIAGWVIVTFAGLTLGAITGPRWPDPAPRARPRLPRRRAHRDGVLAQDGSSQVIIDPEVGWTTTTTVW